jgi:hypothetical protein
MPCSILWRKSDVTHSNMNTPDDIEISHRESRDPEYPGRSWGTPRIRYLFRSDSRWIVRLGEVHKYNRNDGLSEIRDSKQYEEDNLKMKPPSPSG